VGQRSQRLKRGRGRRASGLSGCLAGPAGRWWENTHDAAERGAMLGRGVRKNGPAEHGWAEWKAGSRAGLRGARLQCWVWIWVTYWVSIFLFFFYFLSLFYF